jgi:hypothetical protein
MHKLLQKQLKKLDFKDGKFPGENLAKFIELVKVYALLSQIAVKVIV